MSNVIVVDTNIWIDYLFGDRAENGAAKRFLLEARRIDAPLVIAPHSLCDVFFIVQQRLKEMNRQDGKLAPEEAAASARSTAWASIDFIMELAAAGPSDQADALIAAKYRNVHGDYEDNLVIACAMRTEARLLVTNNAKLIRHSPVAAMRANDAANLLALE